MVSQPRLTLIVPAHNASTYLQRTLPVIKAALRDDYEFIVVDDGSTDNTAALAEDAGATLVRLPEKSGPSAARNAGAAIARGSYLAFLDADVEPRSDTLNKLLESLDQHPQYAAVFGSYDNNPADTSLVSSFKNLMHHYVHQHGEAEAQTFWTGCGAIRRDVFEKIGPFRKVSIVCVEDIDYGHRLRDAGERIWLRNDILCKHLKRWTLWGLVRTDVLQRGVPWTVMMLRRGHVDNELNLNRRHRMSALLALGVAVALCFAIFGSFVNWTLALASAFTGIGCWATLIALQYSFYAFLARQRGWFFALACTPLHLLYYWYSTVSVAVGVIVHLTHRKH